MFFCVSYADLFLFAITFSFLYISTNVIIVFNFYPRINKQYIHTSNGFIKSDNENGENTIVAFSKSNTTVVHITEPLAKFLFPLLSSWKVLKV